MIHLSISPEGQAQCLYTEELDLTSLGPLQVSRASTVEFDEGSQEWVVRREHGGEVLFRHRLRSICLTWEHDNQDQLLC
jgi:hypothetical protein